MTRLGPTASKWWRNLPTLLRGGPRAAPSSGAGRAGLCPWCITELLRPQGVAQCPLPWVRPSTRGGEPQPVPLRGNAGALLGAAPGQADNAETWKQPEMVSMSFIAGSGRKGTGQFGAVATQCPGTTAPSCHGAAALPSRSIWRGGCVLGSPEAAGVRISSQGHSPMGSGHGQESSLLLHVPLGPQALKECSSPELALAAPTVTLSWAPQGCGPFCLPPGPMSRCASW